MTNILRAPSTRIASSIFALVLMLVCGTASPVVAFQDGEVDELIRDISLEGQERVKASQTAKEAAQKLMNELRYVEAEEKLQEATRLDPSNQSARQMLDTVMLILGDRSGDIQDLRRRLVEEKNVRLQQDVFELERLYLTGRRAMDDNNYGKAITTFDQVLERIRWFPFDFDLTDQQNRAI
ncbi:MAG: hypothetical protein AAEJ47_06170, partial [Planctomycetota bacterium]